jgi:hypothetical protein
MTMVMLKGLGYTARGIIYDTTTMLLMTLLMMTLLIMTILITLHTGNITHNDMSLLITVNIKHKYNVSFINVISKVLSIVVVSNSQSYHVYRTGHCC